MSGWGMVMKSYYDKKPNYKESDLTLVYVGYWTDGGIYLFIYKIIYLTKHSKLLYQRRIYCKGKMNECLMTPQHEL